MRSAVGKLANKLVSYNSLFATLEEDVSLKKVDQNVPREVFTHINVAVETMISKSTNIGIKH